MFKINILKRLYKRAPMNFYNYGESYTIIKSINNTFLGYKINKILNPDEISLVWDNVKKHKRFSTITIFVLFIILLYGIIFPNYYFLAGQKWYYTVLPMLVVVYIVYQAVTYMNTLWFEKQITKEFGNFEKTVFNPSDIIDEKYYKLFKLELLKAFILILIIAVCLGMGSPYKTALDMIEQGKYNEAIKVTTIGSKVFPIAPRWYSLRGYAKFQIKDYEGAIADYDKAYKLGPDEYNVMNFDNKIYIKYYTGQYKSALKDFDNEIEHASSDFERDSFLWDKAQFLYNIGEYQQSLKIYNDLLVKSENDRVFLLQNRLYFERAEVYKQLGEEELAGEDIKNADALNIEESFKNPIPAPTLLLDNT